MEGFLGEEYNLEVNWHWDGEPVDLLQGGSYVASGVGIGEEVDNRVLVKLQLL